MTQPAVTVEGVSKIFRVYHDRNQSLKATILNGGRAKYEEFWALKDVGFEIPEGKTFGLLGNNGSGKSTLLKCIARILTPNRGSIAHRGRLAAMLEVGSGFHPELSGRENVYLNGSILGMTKAEIDRKFDAIVDFSGVEEFIDQPVKNYSSGMYVRLGFAVSIHVEPDILLVDEVLAVGDMQFQEKCMEKFADFKRDGRTVVVVSHGLEQMRTFCDEAAWLQHGVLKDVGRARDIIDGYSNEERKATIVDSGGTRFGTGEIQVERLELLHPERGDTRAFHVGEPVTIRMHFNARERVERPVFGASIDRIDGMVMWGDHALDGGFVPESVGPGTGSIDIEIPRMIFQPGPYELSVSIQDFDCVGMYDAWQRAIKFAVGPGTPFESGGAVVLDARFGGLTPERPLVELPERELDARAEPSASESDASADAGSEGAEQTEPADSAGSAPDHDPVEQRLRAD